MATEVPVKRSSSRVFVTQFGNGPSRQPEYLGRATPGAITVPYGDVTRHTQPSDTAYGAFQTIAQTRGERGNASLTLNSRYVFSVSRFRELADMGCEIGITLHMGQCADPQDFDSGWDLMEAWDEALISSIDVDQLGALQEGDENLVSEDPSISAPEPYQIKPLNFAERAGTQVQNEVIAVSVCDAVSCGDCEDPSQGDRTVLATQLSSGGSPGLLAEVVYSEDAGGTWLDTLIDTLAANEEPDDATCVGTQYVVVSEDSLSHHYAPVADILDAAETWTEVTGGYNALGGPRAIFSLSARETWVVGAAGFIYLMTDPTAAVTVQDAGIATSEDLNDVHAFNSNVVVAVGENNAVVYTTDGGTTWQLVVGPSVGVVLNTVWVRSEREWLIGDAGGQFWYTLDQGVNWTEKSFSGSGAGEVREIVFRTPRVGYMSHDTAVPAGRIFRTVNGGFTWYILPEKIGSIPANDRINALAVPHGAPPIFGANQIYGGGLADNATDGILVAGK